MGLLGTLFGSTHRLFTFAGAKLQPSQLGEAFAKLVSQSSPQRVRDFVALGDRHGSADTLFARINAQPVHAQAQLIALECSAELFHAMSLPGLSNDVRDEVVAGMCNAFHAGVGSIAPALTHAIGKYFSMLQDEGRVEERGFDLGGGPTATAVYEAIVESYDSFAPISGQAPVAVEVTDAIRIKTYLQALIHATVETQRKLNLRFFP